MAENHRVAQLTADQGKGGAGSPCRPVQVCACVLACVSMHMLECVCVCVSRALMCPVFRYLLISACLMMAKLPLAM